MSGKKQENSVSAEPATQGGDTTRGNHHDFGWVKAGIWTKRMVSALVNGVRGGKWFSLIDKVYNPETLKEAWQSVARNRGAAGVDGQTVERFSYQSDRYLEELRIDLRNDSYHPAPVKRVEIPKAEGKTRPLGIPTVKDRVVQTAIKNVIEPIFEIQFRPTSYGFRPGLGCKDALREVDRLLKAGYTHVVDADIKSCFDTIPHNKLMDRLEDSISDGRMLALIERFLKQDIMAGMTRWQPTQGTPQGAVLSPLLANLYLHPLDELMERFGYKMVRYADDFVILCQTKDQAEDALHQVQTWTDANGLTLHPDKTHIGDCLQPGQGF
jgi:RNA-directed DNA polymerase